MCSILRMYFGKHTFSWRGPGGHSGSEIRFYIEKAHLKTIQLVLATESIHLICIYYKADLSGIRGKREIFYEV